jgi:hypothetical protein
MAEQESMYLAVIAATTVILIMATNTSFAGFPRLSALLSKGWLAAAAAGISGQPLGLLARHRLFGTGRLRLNRYL